MPGGPSDKGDVECQTLSETLLLITPCDESYITSTNEDITNNKRIYTPSKYSIYDTRTQPCDRRRCRKTFYFRLEALTIPGH